MKKGILKALGITALVAVSAVGGLALGAEISNGFEKNYTEEQYIEYGDKQYQAGLEAGQIKDPDKIYLEDIFNGQSLNIHYLDNNLTFLSCNNTSIQGIYKLNNDNSLTQIYSLGSWDTFIPDENGVTISSSVNADQGKVYYDFTTGSITPIEEESSYESLALPYSEFKAKMVDDDFYIFNSEDKTQFNQVVTTYNLLDSIAFRKTAIEENGNKKSTYEIYCFYGTEEEAKAVNMWTYDYDQSVADSLFGAGEDYEFDELNAKIMLEGIFTMFLNGQDINIEAYDGSSLLLFDVSEIEEALSVNL